MYKVTVLKVLVPVSDLRDAIPIDRAHKTNIGWVEGGVQMLDRNMHLRPYRVTLHRGEEYAPSTRRGELFAVSYRK